VIVFVRVDLVGRTICAFACIFSLFDAAFSFFQLYSAHNWSYHSPRSLYTSRELKEVFDHVVRLEPLDSGDGKNLALLGRPELGITFTKLRIWSLTDYAKAVFLDADTIVLQNVDELFERHVVAFLFSLLFLFWALFFFLYLLL
jgi:lipopolysaccharide biosynthesis glycosyltransferase